MKLKITYILICLLLPCRILYGQTVIDLTYNESIEMALRQGYTFKQQENSFRSSYFRLQASKAGLRSNARIDVTLPAFDASINEQYNFVTESYQFINSQQMKFEIETRINQPISFGGGNISLNGRLSHTGQVTPGLPETHDRYRKSDRYFGRLFLEFEQPILQPNELKNDVEKSEMALARTRYSYSQRKSGTISFLVGSFYDLFRFQKQIELKRELAQQYENAYNSALARAQEGNLDERELLNLEVDLANIQSDLLKLRSDRQNREATFKQSIGFQDDNQDQEINAIANLSVLPVNVSLDEAIQKGLENRVEIRRFALDLRQQELDIEEIKAEGRLTGELKITLGFDNSINGELFNRNFYDPLGDVFRNYDRSRSIMLKFNMPILDWGRNSARLQEKSVSLERTKNSQINTSRNIRKEITDTYFTLNETLERLSLTRRSRIDAQRIYELTLIQFNNGEVTSQDLRLAKDRFIASDNFLLNAYVEYQKAVVDLNSKTMWDFLNDISFVTEEEINNILESTNNNNNNN